VRLLLLASRNATLDRRCGHVLSTGGHPSLPFVSSLAPLAILPRDDSSSRFALLPRIAHSLLLHIRRITIHTALEQTDIPQHTDCNINSLFDCTIIARRASTNAFATHKASRDTSETYRLSASRSIAKHYNTLRAVHTNLIAPHIIHNGRRPCSS